MTLPGFAPTAPVPPARRDEAGDRLHPQLDMHCETACSHACADVCQDVPSYEAGDCLNRCTESCLIDCRPPEYLSQ
ncbi:hypothetical protein OG250_32055 [Streptomyces sp. NBC_00487]|uniref:hypothetical protein n=1 Tax=unclassified Streptomyces TaxID=2593676 RepID=UPI002DDBA875|nr:MULTISPECIES: hypothetical protein [unclassified Streptomyces]WRY99016.1 hypothetical protein OG889_32600 [Streptomyces sp. NBC_00481]